MTVSRLIERLQKFNPQAEVVLRQNVSDGSGGGDVYESLDIMVSLYQTNKVKLEAAGVKLAGGW